MKEHCYRVELSLYAPSGIKVLFRTTLAIMKLTLTPKDLQRCQGYVDNRNYMQSEN